MNRILESENPWRFSPLTLEKALKGILIPSYFTISLIFLMKSVRANLDLSTGRFALFMDEQVTFDGVRAILHPQSPFLFFYAILDGGDQRYGRLLWNVSAVFAFIPEKIFGESGQIVTTRMLSTTLLMVAAGFLARAFSRSLVTHFLIYTTILSLPFVAYYATMPKPEPLQLLVVGLIANLIVKKRDFESRRLFILLGLLLGIKISSLTILIPIILWLAWKLSDSAKMRQNWISWRLGAFNCGLFLAVPTLLPTLIVITIGSLLFENRFKNAKLKLLTLIAFLTSSGLAVIVVNQIILMVVNRNFLLNYLNYTVLGTSSGSDSRDVTPVTWLSYFLTSWSPLPTAFLVALLSLGGVLFFYSIRGDIRGTISDPKTIFVLSALASIGLTFLSVDRIWGFYLLLGTAILFSACLGLIADWALSKNLSVMKKAKVGLALLMLITFNATSFVGSMNELSLSANRTQRPDHKLQMKSFVEIKSTIQNYVENHPGKYRMALDPNYFQIEELPDVSIDRFWGPFNGWGQYDFIVLKPSHLPPFADMQVGTSEESAKALSVQKFHEVFAKGPEECLRAWCYTPIGVLPDHGKILLKVMASDKPSVA